MACIVGGNKNMCAKIASNLRVAPSVWARESLQRKGAEHFNALAIDMRPRSCDKLFMGQREGTSTPASGCDREKMFHCDHAGPVNYAGFGPAKPKRKRQTTKIYAAFFQNRLFFVMREQTAKYILHIPVMDTFNFYPRAEGVPICEK